MGTEVSTQTTNPMEEFQNKLKEKVRSDIADLLPESAIAELVKRAIDEEFFKKGTKNVGSSYNPQWMDTPSVFVQEVVKAADPLIKKEIARVVEEKKALIQEGVDQYLKENNLTLIIATAIGQQMQNNVYTVVQDIMNQSFRR